MAKQRKTYRKLIITTYLSGVWKGNERTKKITDIYDFKIKLKALPRILVGPPRENACMLSYA